MTPFTTLPGQRVALIRDPTDAQTQSAQSPLRHWTPALLVLCTLRPGNIKRLGEPTTSRPGLPAAKLGRALFNERLHALAMICAAHAHRFIRDAGLKN